MSFQINYEVISNKLSYAIGMIGGIGNYATKTSIWERLNWETMLQSIIVGVSIALTVKLIVWLSNNLVKLVKKKFKKHED